MARNSKPPYFWLKKQFNLDEHFPKEEYKQTAMAVWFYDPLEGSVRVDKRALSLMIAARQILDRQNPMTLRGLYYALFGAGWVLNCDEAYNAMKGIIVQARRLGFIPWDHIEDATREPHVVQAWTDLPDFMDTVKSAYRRDVWQAQSVYVEVLIEKRTGVAQAKKVCQPYGVTVASGNGYGGWSAIYDLAKRLQAHQQYGRDTVILYVGDFDPSGLHMFFDLQQRLKFFVQNDDLDEMPEFRRLGVNDDDIMTYELPEAPGKMTDSRADWMEREYGKLVQVEMDALWAHTEENIFAEKVRQGIESILDMDVYHATVEQQRRERRALVRAVDLVMQEDLDSDDDEEE